MVVQTQIEIEGTTRRDQEQIQVTSSIGDDNSSSSFKATFPNEDGLHNTDFNIGNEVIIRADEDTEPPTTSIFRGLIADIKFKGKGQVNEKIIISGRDYSSLLQDITIQPTVFNDTEISSIVTTLMSDNIPIITTTNVDVTTTTLDHIAFNQVTVFDALKQLAEFAGFFFFVDTNRDLNFTEKGSVVSGQTLDTTNVIRSTIKESDQELYNRVWVYGDSTRIGNQEYFATDGVGSAFTLQFKPHATEVFLGSPPETIQRGGVFNIGPLSGTDYLVNFDSGLIVFVTGTDIGYSSIPPVGSITVNYQRDRPIVKLAEDQGSIEQFNEKTKVIIDKSIKQASLAKDLAQNFLDLHKNPFKQGIVKLQGVIALTAGQTVILNLPDENINNITMTMLEVRYDFNVANNQADRVLTVKLNDKLRDAVDTLKEIIIAIRKLQAGDISDAEILTRLQLGAGSLGLRNSGFEVFTRDIGSAWIVAHTTNGVIGSPAQASGLNQGQVTIGDARGGLVSQVSGGRSN